MAAVPKTAGQLYDSAILKVAAEEQKKANADPLFPAAEPNPLKVFLGGYTPMISLGVIQKDRYNAGAYTSDESIEYLIIGEGGNVGKKDPAGLGKRPNTFYGAPEYYINNFEVDTIHVPDSQVGSTSATRFQFQVFEPYSMGIFYQSMQLAAIKAKYPNILVWTKSSSFANGNSLDVYVCEPNGNEVENSIWNDVRTLVNAFEYGKFNGWTDCYDSYETSGLKTESGTEIEAGVKYVHVDNKAPFGTYPDVVRMLRGMMAGEYVFGPLSLENAIKKVKGYKVTDATIEKALPYLKVA
jgi:hypothetical protein